MYDTNNISGLIYSNDYYKNNYDNYKNNYDKQDYNKITEEDFYPPKDNREYKSGIDDIVGGDNFADYFESFFKAYENDLFDN